MATYWKLSKKAMGDYDFRSTYVEPNAQYLYRHGDYFDTRDEEITFRRRSDDEVSTKLLEDVRNTLSGEYVHYLIRENYKSDGVSEVTVDQLLEESVRLKKLGLSEATLSTIAHWRDDDESLMTVPKPWTNKDAYLVGSRENYRITLAPVGETNKIIDKAEVVYQLTDHGHWVDDRYPAVATLGATKVTHQRPTFETSRFAVSQILNPQTEVVMNWDEVWADLGVTPDELSLG